MRTGHWRLPAAAMMTLILVGVRPAPAGQFVNLLESVTDASGELDGAWAVAVSPDGLHVYATAPNDDLVALYERDTVTGELDFVVAYTDGMGGVTGLDAPQPLAVSPDGLHLYVGSAATPRSFVVFERDLVDGTLTPVDVQPTPDPNRDAPVEMVFTADGAFLYVAFASSFSSPDRDFGAYARDPVTGALTFLQSTTAYVDIRGIALSPDELNLYLSSSTMLAVFGRDPVTGLLSFQQNHVQGQAGVFGIDDGTGVVVSGDGAHVYASAEDDDAVALFTRDPGSGNLLLTDVVRQGVAGVDGLLNVQHIVLSGDGAHLYAVGSGRVGVFARDPGNGTLTFVEQLEVPETTGARFLALVADDHLYVPGPSADSLVALDRDAGTGTLTLVEVESRFLLGPDLGLDGVNGMAITSDGSHAYAGASGSVIVFGRAPTGELTHQQTLSGIPFLDFVTALALSPDDAHLYVTSQSSDAVLTFARDAGTGMLTFVEAIYDGLGQVDGVGGVQGLDSPRDVRVSPDGAHVYVAGDADDAIAMFARAPGSGQLTYLGGVFEDQGGIGQLDAKTVVLSSDGTHLYEAGGSSVSVFARDAGSGLLTFLQSHRQNVEVPDDILGGADLLVLSPDGQYLYVGSSDGIAVFRRDATSGLLSLGKGLRDDDVPEVGNPTGLTLRSDGALLFATRSISNAAGGQIAVLNRNPVTGTLALLETVDDPLLAGPQNALTGLAHPTVSPDGAHLYVTAGAIDRVTSFSVNPCNAAVKPKLTFKRINTDVDPTNDDLVLVAEVVLSSGTFGDLDPSLDGLHLVVENAAGVPRVDVTVPGGVFGGGASAGWITNAAGNRWTYLDKTGAPLEGIQRIKLNDKSKAGSPVVKIVTKGKRGTYPVVAGDEPLAGAVDLGGSNCALAVFGAGECRFNSTGSVLKCKE